MRTDPEKCKTCKHGATDPAEEPCFTCVNADAFESGLPAPVTPEALKAALADLESPGYAPGFRRRRCSGGRMCYCAPFEDEPPDLANDRA